MIMNTNPNRIFEHLNTFSIDYYKQQQEQQQPRQEYNENKMNMTPDQHDKILQTNIKDEKQDHHVDNYLKSSGISTDNIDQPLLIVLDEDDTNCDDENEQYHKVNSKNEEQIKTNSSIVEQSLNKSNSSKSKIFPRPKKSRLFPSLNDRHHRTSNKFIRTVVIDTSFMRQQNRHKLLTRRKNLHSLNMSNNSNTKTLSLDENSTTTNDSILSNLSFDNIADILTVSRMGSIFYCLEDLYTKVFSSLCTLDEFINLLSKPEIILIKQVTLSEKMSIEQQIPTLKKFNENRYRLISINSSDYLVKLKQLLLTIENNIDENEKQQREKRIDQIIDEMRSYKRTPTVVLLKDKISNSPMATKRLSSDDDDDDDDEDDDDEPHERLKIVTKKPKPNETPPLAPTQFGIFIQCNGPVSCNIFSTNETVSASTTTTNNAETTTTMTTTTVAKTEASEIISKSTIIKKQNENTQIYFDKFQQQYQNIPKSNTVYNRTDSQSPTDCAQLNKLCSSSTVTNMPIKRRILNSYNSDASDSSNTTNTVHRSSISRNSSRYLYRSKSLSIHHNHNEENKNLLRRSSSLPTMIYYSKENFSNKNFYLKEQTSKINMKSKAEPIDLTDGNYSMPMIVNVEENVEFNNQRQKVKNNKSTFSIKQQSQQHQPQYRISDSGTHISPPTVISRSISHESDSSMLTKPISTHHPTLPPTSLSSSSSSSLSSSSSAYRTSPYHHPYHQESYTYRDSSQNIPHSYIHSSNSHPTNHNNNINNNNNNNNNHANTYPYPFSSSAQYPIIKKTKESSLPNSFDTRLNHFPSNHPSSSLNNNNNNNNSHIPSAVVMPIVRKPNYYHQLTPEQQASIKIQTTSPPTSMPCRLPCCYPPTNAQHSTEKSLPNERTIYRQYPVPTPSPQIFKREPSQTPDIQNSSPSIHRKQRRIDSIPVPPPTSLTPSTTPYPHYPSTKSYFAPPPPPPSSVPSSSSSSSSSNPSSHWPLPSPSPSNPNLKPPLRYSYPPPPNTPVNGMVRKMEPYPQPRRPTPVQSRLPPPPSTPIVVQNSSTLISPPNTPHELTLPSIRTRSIDLQRAIMERGYCDMDKLPKLVVRHTKTYSNRTVDTMGQLFPTWFNEPDYRCIHCFRCDQVFTPQQFMTHVDDEFTQNEQPISMTSIQLLTAEKMSEYKVGLWNQFCTNLTIYAREGRIGGFSTNRNA